MLNWVRRRNFSKFIEILIFFFVVFFCVGTRSETGSESFSQSASSLDREDDENSIVRQETPPPTPKTPKDDFEVLTDLQISEMAKQNFNEDLNQIVPVSYDDQALVSMKEKSTQEKVKFLVFLDFLKLIFVFWFRSWILFVLLKL